ncbi:MAG: ABC transporter permease [Clostridia bacterium]|nr:ABC transporter permease [Clostridia bacterium]
MDNRSPLLKRDGTQKLLASLISIVIGLIFGSILVAVVGLLSKDIGGKGIWDGIRLIFIGLFSKTRDTAGNLTWGFNSTNFGNMLFRATPLIMTGLSVAVSQKTGLFNIGAPGQYLMGTLVSLMIALGVPTTAIPPVIVWLLAFLGGMLAGALWGAIPGMLKAFLNINEVIACIMTNWIAAVLVSWAFSAAKFSVVRGQYFNQTDWTNASGTFQNIAEGTKSSYVYKTIWNNVATPKLGLDKIFPNSQVNAGILIAILIAIAMFVLINKTTFGFQLKACGANRHAARYVGIKDKNNIVYSMAIAGALAAGGAALYTLAGNTEFSWNTYQKLPAIGFNGIPVALLATNNPIGVIFSGIFMAMLNIVGTQLTKFTAYNEYITDVIIAAIVYLSAFALVIRMMFNGSKKKAHAAEPAPAVAEPAEPATEPIADAGEDPAPDAAVEEEGGENA